MIGPFVKYRYNYFTYRRAHPWFRTSKMILHLCLKLPLKRLPLNVAIPAFHTPRIEAEMSSCHRLIWWGLDLLRWLFPFIVYLIFIFQLSIYKDNNCTFIWISFIYSIYLNKIQIVFIINYLLYSIPHVDFNSIIKCSSFSTLALTAA